jgi:hypothetical protein
LKHRNSENQVFLISDDDARKFESHPRAAAAAAAAAWQQQKPHQRLLELRR